MVSSVQLRLLAKCEDQRPHRISKHHANKSWGMMHKRYRRSYVGHEEEKPTVLVAWEKAILPLVFHLNSPYTGLDDTLAPVALHKSVLHAYSLRFLRCRNGISCVLPVSENASAIALVPQYKRSDDHVLMALDRMRLLHPIWPLLSCCRYGTALSVQYYS